MKGIASAQLRIVVFLTRCLVFFFFFDDSFVLLRCDEFIITFRNSFSSGHLISIFQVAPLKFAQTLA